MASFGSVIYARLRDDDEISSSVNGDILPEFRDDLCPAIVYEYSIDSIDEFYEGQGVVDYEVTISVVATTYKAATEIADLIVASMGFDDWTDGGYVVLGCYYRDRDEAYVEVGSKNERRAVVDLRFEMKVKTT